MQAGFVAEFFHLVPVVCQLRRPPNIHTDFLKVGGPAPEPVLEPASRLGVGQALNTCLPKVNLVFHLHSIADRSGKRIGDAVELFDALPVLLDLVRGNSDLPRRSVHLIIQPRYGLSEVACPDRDGATHPVQAYLELLQLGAWLAGKAPQEAVQKGRPGRLSRSRH